MHIHKNTQSFQTVWQAQMLVLTLAWRIGHGAYTLREPPPTLKQIKRGQASGVPEEGKEEGGATSDSDMTFDIFNEKE